MSTTRSRHAKTTLTALAAAAFLAGLGIANAQDYYQTAYYPHEHYFSVGIRAGGMVLTDEDARDIYDDGVGTFGLDFHFHFFDWPLATRGSFDFSAGDGDPNESLPGVLDTDADLFLFNSRLSLVLEPPPGFWGSPNGDFYVTPYIGAGVGLHYVEEDVDRLTTFGITHDDDSDANIGFHLVGGIDFTFAEHYAAGLEVLYVHSNLDSTFSSVEFDGIGIMATFKLKF